MSVTLAVFCMMACALQGVFGHGGGLHPWTWSTPGKQNVTRMLLATTGPFKYYDVTRPGALPGPIPVLYSNSTTPATVAGNIQVWQYLDGCTSTMTLIANLKLTKANKPIAGAKVYGWGMTGNCSAAGDIYRHNATLPANFQGSARFNMVWFGKGFDEGFTNSAGNLVGAAPNIFFPRQTASAAGPALKSIIISPDPRYSTLLCADLTWAKYNTANWAKQVASCKHTGGGGH